MSCGVLCVRPYGVCAGCLLLSSLVTPQYQVVTSETVPRDGLWACCEYAAVLSAGTPSAGGCCLEPGFVPL